MEGVSADVGDSPAPTSTADQAQPHQPSQLQGDTDPAALSVSNDNKAAAGAGNHGLISHEVAGADCSDVR